MILQATIECLAEYGYDRLTMQMVAERARAGKGALYRRWPSKADLVIEAVTELYGRDVPIPDTGSLRGDLDELARQVPDAASDQRRISVIIGLATAAHFDPVLAAAYQEKFIAPRAGALRAVLSRAQERGEIRPGRDIDLLVAVVPALLLVTGAPNGPIQGRAFAQQIFDEIVYPAAIWDAH